MEAKSFKVTLAYNNLDIFDISTAEALVDALDGLELASIDGVTRVTATISGVSNSINAVRDLDEAVRRAVPDARAVRAYPTLVSASDIAHRVNVSREAVRMWASGARGPGGFPEPLGTVAGSTRVWDWAHVNHWLNSQLGLGESEHVLDAETVAMTNADLARWGGYEVVGRELAAVAGRRTRPAVTVRPRPLVAGEARDDSLGGRGAPAQSGSWNWLGPVETAYPGRERVDARCPA